MNTAETIVSQLLAIHFADNVTLKARITILRFQMLLLYYCFQTDVVIVDKLLSALCRLSQQANNLLNGSKQNYYRTDRKVTGTELGAAGRGLVLSLSHSELAVVKVRGS